MGIRPAHVAWVVLGGSIGTALRDLLGGASPAEPGSFPWTTFLINVAGSLLLGILLAGLAAGAGARTAGSPRALTTRLALGTGLLGGFTTYSTFAVETVELASAAPVTAVAYAFGSLAVG
ncbi:MAG TPA: CrcB family protein, partial [Actinomycetales bacterium]|nr:CrcB family protein [Actinomycetales bacterium]